MSYIVDYGRREAYKSMKSMDKLAQIDPMINWESLRPIVKEHKRVSLTSSWNQNWLKILYKNFTGMIQTKVEGPTLMKSS